jgi:serine/threonine-protein kinase RsbW
MRERRPARPDCIGPLRRAVVALADGSGASQLQSENIAIAVSEAVSNAVVHAYADRSEPGDVVVRARVHDRCLEVEVCDEGSGMQPRPDSPGLGLGLPLIVRVTQALEVEETMPGVRLRMTFALG